MTDILGAPDGAPVRIGLAVLAAGGLAVRALAVRVGADERSVSDVLAVVLVSNLVVVIPVVILAPAPSGGVPLSALGAFAAAGVLGSLPGRTCYCVGIVRPGASRAEPLRALLPLFAVGLAVAVLDEPLTPLLDGGVLLLVLGGMAVGTEAQTSAVTATGSRRSRDPACALVPALLYGIDPVEGLRSDYSPAGRGRSRGGRPRRAAGSDRASRTRSRDVRTGGRPTVAFGSRSDAPQRSGRVAHEDDG